MRSSAAFILIAVAGLGLSLSGGCGSNAIEGHTRPTLQSINGGAPLHADVFVVDTTVAGMGYIPEESVEVVFTNPPSHLFMDLDESDPYGTFIVDAYTVPVRGPAHAAGRRQRQLLGAPNLPRSPSPCTSRCP